MSAAGDWVGKAKDQEIATLVSIIINLYCNNIVHFLNLINTQRLIISTSREKRMMNQMNQLKQIQLGKKKF